MPSTLPRPLKTLTKGLDFSSLAYKNDKNYSSQDFIGQVSKVLEFLKNNLPKFAELKNVVKLSLGIGPDYSSPAIFIDSTGVEVKLLDAAPDGVEPEFVANIMPEYVLDVIEGRMHAQHAFGKRAVPPCPGAFAACFSPMGRPTLVTHADELDNAKFPKPTEDIEQVKSDLQRWGYAFIANALSPEQVAILRNAIVEQATGERKAGIAHMDSSHKKVGDQPNQRIWNLPNKGDEFLDLLNHPLIDTIMPWFLGDGFNLHTMSANIALRGSSGIYMHRDQLGFTPETVDHAYLLNAIWYLTDVTAEKGATLVYPGSHDRNVAPLGHLNDVGGSIPAAAPSGTVLLLDSRTWHSTGINRTNDPRPVILQAFCRFFIQRMENYPLLLSQETKTKLSDRQKALLGFPVPVREGEPRAHVSGYTAYDRSGEDAGVMRVAVTE